jgi:Spore germination protein.
MFSGNNKISNRQLKKMLILNMLSISSLIIPYIAVNCAGVQGIFLVLIGAAFALLYAMLMCYFVKQFQTNTYVNYARRTVGALLTGVIGLLHLLKFFLMLSFAAAIFTNVIGQTLLVDTNTKIILAFLLLISGYGALQGIEKRARLSEILFYIILVPITLYLLLGLAKVDWSNLFIDSRILKNSGIPVFGVQNYNLLLGGFFIFLTYSVLEFILFANPYFKNNKDRSMFFSTGEAVFLISLLNILIYVITVGILGTGETGGKLWSAVTIMQIVKFPGGFIQRQDGILLAFWMLSMFSILSSCLYYMARITQDFIQQCMLKRCELYSPINKYLVLLYGILSFGFVISFRDIQTQFLQLGKYLVFIGIPQSIVIPALLICINKIKRRASADEK